MIKGELPITLYWVAVAIILSLYIWVLKTVDLGFYILLIILVVMGIGYHIIIAGETETPFFEKKEVKEVEEIKARIEKLDNKIEELSKTIDEIKKMFEE